VIDAATLAEFLRREFPQSRCTVESVDAEGVWMAHPVGEAELRPGGTVSGPVMMTLADVCLAVLKFYITLLRQLWGQKVVT
jgi:acyl-coenzyme A thioesterase PaaI-like protein